MHSATTVARAANTSAAETGRVSRQTMPLPSRHQALTAKRRAAPLAARPGRTITVLHCNPATSATRPGPAASTIRPRRMPIERHTEPRSSRRSRARSGDPQRGSGTWRASCTPDWTRSSSRGGRPSAHAAGRAPSPTKRTAASRRTEAATYQRSPCMVSASQGGRQGLDDRGQPPGEVQRDEDEDHERATGADGEHPVRRTSYALHGPADRLPQGGGREDPGQHDRLGAHQPSRRSDQRDDGQQAPELDEPGQVERSQREGAEVLGPGADGMDRRLAARQQLAAAARAHGRGDRQREHAEQGGADVATQGVDEGVEDVAQLAARVRGTQARRRSRRSAAGTWLCLRRPPRGDATSGRGRRPGGRCRAARRPRCQSRRAR